MLTSHSSYRDYGLYVFFIQLGNCAHHHQDMFYLEHIYDEDYSSECNRSFALEGDIGIVNSHYSLHSADYYIANVELEFI